MKSHIVAYKKGAFHELVWHLAWPDLFKLAHDFTLQRYAIFLPLWLAGVWFAARRWRDPRYALMLWLLAGIMVSSPFITFDGGKIGMAVRTIRDVSSH